MNTPSIEFIGCTGDVSLLIKYEPFTFILTFWSAANPILYTLVSLKLNVYENPIYSSDGVEPEFVHIEPLKNLPDTVVFVKFVNTEPDTSKLVPPQSMFGLGFKLYKSLDELPNSLNSPENASGDDQINEPLLEYFLPNPV